MPCCKNIPNGKTKVSYVGNEPSPKGRGICAKYADPSKRYKGLDNKMWHIQSTITGHCFWKRGSGQHGGGKEEEDEKCIMINANKFEESIETLIKNEECVAHILDPTTIESNALFLRAAILVKQHETEIQGFKPSVTCNLPKKGGAPFSKRTTTPLKDRLSCSFNINIQSILQTNKEFNNLCDALEAKIIDITCTSDSDCENAINAYTLEFKKYIDNIQTQIKKLFQSDKRILYFIISNYHIKTFNGGSSTLSFFEKSLLYYRIIIKNTNQILIVFNLLWSITRATLSTECKYIPFINCYDYEANEFYSIHGINGFISIVNTAMNKKRLEYDNKIKEYEKLIAIAIETKIKLMIEKVNAAVDEKMPINDPINDLSVFSLFSTQKNIGIVLFNKSIYISLYELGITDTDERATVIKHISRFTRTINTFSYVYNEISKSYVPSVELNNGILNLIIDQDPLNGIIKERANVVIDGFIKKYKTPREEKEENVRYVFHGTNQLLSDESFTTLAFLSTTTDPDVAITYANNSNYVYIFKLYFNESNKTPYIYFNDSLSQILLPPGLEFKQLALPTLPDNITRKTINNIQKLCLKKTKGGQEADVTFLMYEASPYDYLIFEKFRHMINQTIKNVPIVIANVIKAAQPKFVNHGSSTFFEKDTIVYKKIDKIGRNFETNQIMLRAINEMLSAYIYKTCFEIDAQIYNICLVNDFICLGSEKKPFINTFETENKKKSSDQWRLYMNKMSEQILVDLAMANWDAYSNFNSILDDKDNVFRVDVGGSLSYTGLSDRNYLFHSESPFEHATFNSPGFREIINHVKTLSKHEVARIITINTEKLKSVLVTFDTKINISNVISRIPKGDERYAPFVNGIVNGLKKRIGYYFTHGEAILTDIFSQRNTPNIPITRPPSIGLTDGGAPYPDLFIKGTAIKPKSRQPIGMKELTNKDVPEPLDSILNDPILTFHEPHLFYPDSTNIFNNFINLANMSNPPI